MPSPTDPATAAVLLTPPGEGGISVIRLTGTDAVAILRQVFRVRGDQPIGDLDSSRIHYGSIVDATGAVLDEVIVHSGAEGVDINCHGGFLVTRKIMDRLVALGAQETSAPLPGGDAVQNEAWQALLEAQTGLAAAVFLDQYRGALARRVTAVIDLISSGQAGTAASDLDALLETVRFGFRLVNPPSVVIAGRPNVGKSSLLNAFAGRPRALVHEAPGTTRDYLTVTVAVDGLPVVLLDTAGLRPAEDAIEEAGIDRAVERIGDADLVLAVFDGSEPLREADQTLARHLAERAVVPVINKSDLPALLPEQSVAALVDRVPFRVSARTGEGLMSLGRRVVGELFGPVPPPGEAVLFTVRQRDIVGRALHALQRRPDAAVAELQRLVGGVGQVTSDE